MERLKRTSLYVFFGLLAYMPFHIFLSTWIGTSFGVLEIAKVAKDILLVAGFAMIFTASIREVWFKSFLVNKLTLLILAYAAITVLLAIIKPIDTDAEILAIVYNLRFLLFFVYAGLLTKFYKPDWLRSNVIRVVLVVALPVMLFGALQYMILPDNLLSHFGYSRENGVLPAFFIDDKPDLERVHSTLRDPNSYGSYLLIILGIALVYRLRTTNKQIRNILDGILLLVLLNIYFTFSRGAWLGAVLVVALTLMLIAKQKLGLKFGKTAWLPLIALLIIGSGTLYALRDTYWVQNVVLHSDESTTMEDPNELRIRFWKESLEAAQENPLGYGPGTAGIVSIRNDKQGTVLNENYYLQILHEVGVFGLVFFTAILVLVVNNLYGHKRHLANMGLLVVFFGLAFTNLLVHAWSNEAVAYTFWGIAGILIFGNTISLKKNRT